MKETLIELADALKISLKMAKAKKENDEEVKKEIEDVRQDTYFV